VADGFGGKLMWTVSFFGPVFDSSSSPKLVATVGPRGGRGGGLLASGLGFGFCSVDILRVLKANCDSTTGGLWALSETNFVFLRV